MKRICYIALIFITVYLAVLYNSAAIIFLAGVELLLPLFLFIPLFVGNFLLRLNFVDKNPFWEAGEEVFLGLHLKKRGILPIRQIRFRLVGCNETTGEKYRQWVKLPVERGETPLQEIRLKALGYGVWRFSMKRLRVYDYIRLFRLPHPRAKDVVCVVLPRKYHISVSRKVDGDREQADAVSARKMSWEFDRSDRGELREYRPGDALNDIHWKLSARRDELIVWDRERRRKGGWKLGLDLAGWSREKAELVYSLLSGLCQALGSGTVWFQEKEGEHTFLVAGKDSLHQGMEALMECQIQFFGADDFQENDQVRLLGEMDFGKMQEDTLWVREPLSLWQGNVCLWEIAGLDLENVPENMELRL